MKNSLNVREELGLMVKLKSHPLIIEIELSEVLSQIFDIGLHGLELEINIIHPLFHPVLKFC